MNQGNADTLELSSAGLLSAYSLHASTTLSGKQNRALDSRVLIAARTMQSVMIRSTVLHRSVRRRDSVETYPAAAAQTIVALFTLSAVNG